MGLQPKCVGSDGKIAIITPDSFGYPEAHGDEAERAVSAGLNAVANISCLRSPTGEPLQARVAVEVCDLAAQLCSLHCEHPSYPQDDPRRNVADDLPLNGNMGAGVAFDVRTIG